MKKVLSSIKYNIYFGKIIIDLFWTMYPKSVEWKAAVVKIIER
jgi:hypothetical protein